MDFLTIRGKLQAFLEEEAKSYPEGNSDAVNRYVEISEGDKVDDLYVESHVCYSLLRENSFDFLYTAINNWYLQRQHKFTWTREELEPAFKEVFTAFSAIIVNPETGETGYVPEWDEYMTSGVLFDVRNIDRNNFYAVVVYLRNFVESFSGNNRQLFTQFNNIRAAFPELDTWDVILLSKTFRLEGEHWLPAYVTHTDAVSFTPYVKNGVSVLKQLRNLPWAAQVRNSKFKLNKETSWNVEETLDKFQVAPSLKFPMSGGGAWDKKTIGFTTEQLKEIL